MNHSKNRAHVAARVFLGLTFTVFGLNGFVNFIPQPAPGAEAGAFLGALAATGYMFPLIKATEVAAGLLLLFGRWVPFALTLLAPVVVNIVAFHLFLEPATLAVPLVTLALGLYVAWTERAAYKPLFAPRSRDSSPARESAGGHAASAA